MDKPDDLFDREDEWERLSRFTASDRPGAVLGLVYGRRRQGKTYLLDAFTEAEAGFSFAALQHTGTQNLARLGAAYASHAGIAVPVRFTSWEQALEAVLALGDGAPQPVTVVIDEFPYLVAEVPEIPSIIQIALRPRYKPQRRTRLILCGSALSTTRSLLSGPAPLRGRAALELMVHPFGYRDAARFWSVDHDPDLALRLHALVGGTPAYYDMCGSTAPSARRFDDWVVDALLNPASAMFREGDVLLAEEDQITDAAPYYSVLSTIAQGNTRRGQIAAALGRSQGALSHALAVLVDVGLVEAADDATRDRRTTFLIAEPLIRFHQLVIDPNRGALGRARARQVWLQAADTVSSRIYGPHFEHLARTWCAEHAADDTLGGSASFVGSSVVSCREHRQTHEIDVVVKEHRPQHPDTVVAIGEAKWRSGRCGIDVLERLEHVRDLLVQDRTIKLLLFSRSGFSAALAARSAARPDVELVDLARLYEGD